MFSRAYTTYQGGKSLVESQCLNIYPTFETLRLVAFNFRITTSSPLASFYFPSAKTGLLRVIKSRP